MNKLQSLPWADPLRYAANVDEPYWALLYSGLQASYSGRYSLLALNLAERVETRDFASFQPRLTENQPRFANAWFGYFGYGLKNTLEELPQDRAGWLNLAPLTFMRFNTILEFDHETRTVQPWSSHSQPNLPTPAPESAPTLPPVQEPIASNMTRAQYLHHAETLIARIHAGDLYQANLTRKFSGQFETPPNPFTVFRKLCATSPAAYSAFLKLGDTAVISSSPELFLKIDGNGHIRARPVKGTSPRHAETAADEASKARLSASAKDKAENLMIVDLMRNDLSRTCQPGSVKVESLYEVTSHSHVHHMSSTITGQKRAGCSTLDVISQAFPPGSMTGAPKVVAMRTLTQMEQDDRGIYSGALGWLGGNGSAELSVVIRTLLLRHDRFEFQVGGGIVADSTPESELQETIDKSNGIIKSLNITIHALNA